MARTPPTLRSWGRVCSSLSSSIKRTMCSLRGERGDGQEISQGFKISGCQRRVQQSCRNDRVSLTLSRNGSAARQAVPLIPTPPRAAGTSHRPERDLQACCTPAKLPEAQGTMAWEEPAQDHGPEDPCQPLEPRAFQPERKPCLLLA